VTHVEDAAAAESVGPASTVEALEWIRQNWVASLAALALVVQLWWRAGLLGQQYFRQADFEVLGHARTASFGWGYLMAPSNSQLSPGGRAIAWFEAGAAFYSWALASAVTLLLLAAAGVALLRLLRTMFGPRPAILVPFVAYLTTPLLVPELTSFTATLSWLPLQACVFMALNAHVSYIKAGSRRQLITAIGWVVLGLCFTPQGVLVPFLLFAITSAFGVDGRWLSAALTTIRKHWVAWLAYVVVVCGYCVVVGLQVGWSGFGLGDRLPSASGLLGFGSSVLRLGFIPGSFGGPWRWWSLGSYAIAVRMPVLTAASWVAAVAIVIASLWFRRRAWRSWVILAAYLTASVLIAVLVGPAASSASSILGEDLGYLAAVVPVMVICTALAFWPTTDEVNPYRAPLPARSTRLALAMTGVAVLVVGSLVSANAYRSATSAQPSRSYIATARVALAQVPPTSVIFSEPVPSGVMTSAFFGTASYTASVLGPLAPPASQIRWTSTASGLVGSLLIFDDLGRLWPAGVAGPTGAPSPRNHGCWKLGAVPDRIPLQHALFNWTWIIELDYSGPATTLSVAFGRSYHDVTMLPGLHGVFIPASGSGAAVAVQNLGPGTGGCVSSVTVGTMQPSILGQPLPALPVP